MRHRVSFQHLRRNPADPDLLLRDAVDQIDVAVPGDRLEILCAADRRFADPRDRFVTDVHQEFGTVENPAVLRPGDVGVLPGHVAADEPDGAVRQFSGDRHGGAEEVGFDAGAVRCSRWS